MQKLHSRRSVMQIVLGLGAFAVSWIPKGANAMSLPATPKQVDGPYFLANSPLTTNLIPAGLTGNRIDVSGKVLNTSGAAIANATVHVWLADPAGKYDNQDSRGRPRNIPVSQMKLRGRIITDANGNYNFSALRPGNYDVGAGGFRPAHIHVMVEAQGHTTLITQLYFPDDPWNLKDLPGDDFFQPELLIAFTPGTPQPNVVQQGKFDIVLG